MDRFSGALYGVARQLDPDQDHAVGLWETGSGSAQAAVRVSRAEHARILVSS
jgi:hypothetical protein